MTWGRILDKSAEKFHWVDGELMSMRFYEESNNLDRMHARDKVLVQVQEGLD